MLINISGSSGVGKTTISTIISLVLTNLKSRVLHLCGDDLHKWERGDDNWKTITHLNPKANNLKLGEEQITSLLMGKTIKRDHYDHNTGKFIKDLEITPQEILINEGLHSLYSKNICKKGKLNIFVETEDELKYQWKLNRDTEKRGYTKSQVINAINLRKEDELKYILPQKDNANVIVKFSEKRDKSVHLTYTATTDYGKYIMKRVKDFYDLHRNFLLTCRKSCFEYELIQGAGGNLSYKFEDRIVITSSGRAMSDINILNGFSVCDSKGLPINENQKRPSMEVGFHTKIIEPVVYHTHPIYLNVILCAKNSKEIINNILNLYEYDYIKYYSPGKDLCDNFCKSLDKKIVLLENHGLICCGDSFKEVFDLSLKINQLCKEWLITHAKTFKTFNTKLNKKQTDCFLFPDAAVLPSDNLQINNYILHIQEEVGLEPNCLSKEEIIKLQNMEAEKYRMKLI